MRGERLSRLRSQSLKLAIMAGMLVALSCGGNAEGPVAPAPMLSLSPAAVDAGADTPATAESPELALGAALNAPSESAALLGAPEGPSAVASNQNSASAGYWTGWARIDCATYTRRPEAFCEAMKDAEVAEPSEISTGLTAITAYNDSLIWSGTHAESRLLVSTWSSFIDRTSPGSAYDPGNGFRVGESMVSTRNVFITVVPELREFCEASGPFNDEALRLEQLLGLAPNGGKDSRGNDREFVELWVDPQHLFRPAPDPEISDQEAELGFPRSDWFATVSEDHIQWFRGFKSMSYEETGLPWTRLGYTYDWGNPNSDVGLSEFVIKAGATVQVHSITPTGEYC